MKTGAFVFVLLFTATVLGKGAQTIQLPFDSGNAFLNVCGPVDEKEDLSQNELRDFTSCVGYLRGLHDGIWEASPSNPYCHSDGVTYHQEGRVLLKYMRDNPAKLHQHVSALFLSAMKEAFPCK